MFNCILFFYFNLRTTLKIFLCVKSIKLLDSVLIMIMMMMMMMMMIIIILIIIIHLSSVNTEEKVLRHSDFFDIIVVGLIAFHHSNERLNEKYRH